MSEKEELRYKARSFLFDEQSRDYDMDHSFSINSMERLDSFDEIPVRVPDTAQIAWKCECNFRDVSIGYDTEKTIFVFKITDRREFISRSV